MCSGVLLRTRRDENATKGPVAELIGALSTFHLDGTSAVPTFIEGLREALATDRTAAYSWAHADDTTARVEWAHGGRFPVQRARSDLERLAGRKVAWGGYNPLRPEPWQRNRVFRQAPLLAKVGTDWPIMRCYEGWGIGGHDQLRVLVCEGESLLAYVGAWQPEPFNAQQLRMFRELVRPLQKRLSVERMLGGVPRLRSALETTLDALGREAFITTAHGAIVEANALARLALAADAATTRRDVAMCVRGATGGEYERIPLSGRGEPQGSLVMRRVRDGGRTARASARWSLTRAQARVLSMVCEGSSNRAIAARLGIVERTVEAHLTAIMSKADVESRAELLVRALQ